MTTLSTPGSDRAASRRRGRRVWPDYRAVWRWHFYAGLFCIPFVCWLAATGSLYLFKPQVEAWLDAPYAHVVARDGARILPSAQVAAALRTQPGAVLHAYQLPATSTAAAQVLIGRSADETRVWIDPADGRVLKRTPEDARLMNVVFHLHGELLLGDRGSIVVELAASWAVVMILTGLYLGWPRGARGLAGVIYPRLHLRGRALWRDLHATTGVWVSMFTLVLLASGLPWATSWGAYLAVMRRVGGEAAAHADWTSGRRSELARRAALSAGSLAGQGPAPADPMAGMRMSVHAAADAPSPRMKPGTAYAAIDRVAPVVARRGLVYPVLIVPPLAPGAPWSARSDAQNRLRRVTLTIDGRDGVVIAQRGFAQRDWIDRTVDVGVAAHEGQLFGWLNQGLGLFTATALILVSLSAAVLWWRRRDAGVLGAPVPAGAPRFSGGLLTVVLGLGVLLPLLGASLLAVLLVEQLVLRRIPPVRDWLGLRGPILA